MGVWVCVAVVVCVTQSRTDTSSALAQRRLLCLHVPASDVYVLLVAIRKK